jgi:hypothetical protein
MFFQTFFELGFDVAISMSLIFRVFEFEWLLLFAEIAR